MLIPLHALLNKGRHDEHAVCHDGNRFVLWREFSRQIAGQARELRKRCEPRWLLIAEDPRFFLISFLALLHAGKKVVIPPNSHSGTVAQLANAFDAIVDDSITISQSSSEPFQVINPLATTINLYTSGSTGESKPVHKTLAQFETEINVLDTLWGATINRTIITATAPHHHIYGLLFRLLWPLSAGRAFDTITCTHPDTLGARLDMLGHSHGTVLISSPAQLSRLPELVQLDSLAPSPKMIFSSGGPLLATTATTFRRQLGQSPTEIFGSTETGGIAWRQQEERIGGDTWTPFPGVKVIRDEDGALSLRSPYLPDNSLWHMDDAIELCPGGQFRLGARLDRIVKIEDKRLSLPDMEAQLLAHPWVRSAATVALDGRRKSVGAAVVLTAEGRKHLDTLGRRDTARLLRKHLAAHFEAVLLPRRWRFPEQLPFDERGKLTHSAITSMFIVNSDGREIERTTT